MKLSNFRIKDRILVKNQRNPNVSNQPEKYTDDEYADKNDEINLVSLFQSLQKVLTSIASNQPPKKDKKQNEKNKRSFHFDQMDVRDRFVIYDLPEFKDRKVNLEKVEHQLGKISHEILSVSFNYLIEKKMDYGQMKAFASECFLRNLVLLADSCDLTAKQMEFIDKEFKQKIFPYLITKYPLTGEKQINKALEASVQSVDNSEILENDYLYSSEVEFEYRENGRYDDLIMKLVNEIMLRCDKRENKEDSNFKKFQSLMTTIFEKGMRRNDDDDDDDDDDNQKTTDTYYLIGRKISENTPQYTNQEIQNKSLKTKSPAVLRILTKWCEQLWNKFDNENYFLERTDGLSVIGKKEKIMLDQDDKRWITREIKKEKENILEGIRKIEEVNYAQQIKLFRHQMNRKEDPFIDKEERITGMIACRIVNNLENFLIDYLNLLIHGLLKVSRKIHSELNYFEKLRVPAPFNLLSFKVYDLLRCKYSSNEKRVLKVFDEIDHLSKYYPDKIQIIRIKNRLKLSTSDILINAKVYNRINCEIQIAVNTNQSNFMDCSNKINHFIYELQRAQFGPVLEMASIWKTNEKRSETFMKMIEKQKPLRNKLQPSNEARTMLPYKSSFICSECNLHYFKSNFIVNHQVHIEQIYWKCAECLINDNIKAKNVKFFLDLDETTKYDVEKFQFCGLQEEIPENGACIFIKKPTAEVLIFKKIAYKLKDYLVILKDGKLSQLKILSKVKEKAQFLKDYVVFKLSQNFVDSHFGKNKEQIEDEFIEKLLLPNELRKSFKQSRQLISILNEKNLAKVDMLNFIEQYRAQNNYDSPKTKTIEFSGCKLVNFQDIPHFFRDLTRLYLNKNDLENIINICNFQNLEKIDLSENKIKQIPKEISHLQKLKDLNLSRNQLKTLPEQFFKLKSLETLDLSDNQNFQVPQNFAKLQSLRTISFEFIHFKEFPKTFFKLKNIKCINLWNCNIKSISDQIAQLTNLEALRLNKNLLKSLPEQFSELKKLKQLHIQENRLQSIPENFGNLESLVDLNLSRNRLEKLPQSFINLKNLEIANLRKNKISEFPKDLSNFRNLKTLNLNLNQFKTFPQNLQNLKNLRLLNLEGCLLQSIPQKLDQIQNLDELNLSQNNLQYLPDKLFELKHLTKLNLSHNKLGKIPEKIGYLKMLQIFEMRRNGITGIPQTLYESKNLKILNLDQNLLTEISPQIAKLKYLTSLSIRQNKLKFVPEELCNLKNLQKLNLRNNQIELLPERFFQLTYLTDLDLSKNKLTHLPKKIGELENLASISLSDNKLRQIPCKEGDLKGLIAFFADINDLKELPIFIYTNPNIISVFIANNLIEKLPFEINKMKSLHVKGLFISGNPITDYGDEDFIEDKIFDEEIKKKLKKNQNKKSEMQENQEIQENYKIQEIPQTENNQ